MAADITALIKLVRTAAGDLGVYRTHIVPVGFVNGTNKRFQSSLVPLDSAAKLYDGAGTEKTSGFTFDGDTGMLVYTVAPSLGASHYLEGNVYRYKEELVRDALDQGGRWCYSVWGDSKYVVSGVGDSLAISVEPTGLDRYILATAAAIFLLSGQRAVAALTSARVADASGQMDTTGRSKDIQELVKDLKAQLTLAVRDAGYNLPHSSTANAEVFGDLLETTYPSYMPYWWLRTY